MRSPTATGCRSPGTARPSSTCRRARSRTRARSTSVRCDRPDTQDALNADTSAKLPRPSTGDELRATLLALLGSPHLCSRACITEQYDRYVRGNTVLAEHADGGVLRVDEATGRGIAMSTDASAATPSSTRTPARSSRWPRRTATSRSPARRRSPSPTA